MHDQLKYFLGTFYILGLFKYPIQLTGRELNQNIKYITTEYYSNDTLKFS
jgi:hypothetical protein